MRVFGLDWGFHPLSKHPPLDLAPKARDPATRTVAVGRDRRRRPRESDVPSDARRCIGGALASIPRTRRHGVSAAGALTASASPSGRRAWSPPSAASGRSIRAGGKTSSPSCSSARAGGPRCPPWAAS